jgi:Family of unknown function (DUF6502)
VRNGVTYPEMADMLADSYVNVASAEIRAAGQVVDATAIAVMTAMSVETAQAAIDLPLDAELGDLEKKINAAARLLVGWHTDREYVGPYGLVQELPFDQSDRATRVEGMSFIELAERHCPGIPARSLLNELVRAGCVQEIGNGFYRATRRSYVPEKLSAESIRRFAQVIHNVSETLEFNLRKTEPGSGRIERTVFADYGLSQSDLGDFNRYLRDRGQAFSDDIDNWLARRSKKGDGVRVQTGMGLYHYVVNEQDEKDFNESLREGK